MCGPGQRSRFRSHMAFRSTQVPNWSCWADPRTGSRLPNQLCAIVPSCRCYMSPGPVQPGPARPADCSSSGQVSVQLSPVRVQDLPGAPPVSKRFLFLIFMISRSRCLQEAAEPAGGVGSEPGAHRPPSVALRLNSRTHTLEPCGARRVHGSGLNVSSRQGAWLQLCLLATAQHRSTAGDVTSICTFRGIVIKILFCFKDCKKKI